MKRIVAIVLLAVSLFSVFSLCASAADSFSSVLSQFPDSYKAALTDLHEAHPNWKFERVSVGKNFSVCLNAEHNCQQKLNLVEVSSAKDSRACQSNCKNAKYHTLVDGVYRCASYDYIAECMDPTNYLRESLIFQFEDLGAKAYYTQDKLETALKATSSFMYNKTYRTSSATYYYSKIILDACKTNGVDALFIISRITNEVGSASPAALAKGYSYEYEKGKTKTVYNFFNIGGNVSASAKYAYNHEWFNPKAALEGGIKFIAQNYVKAGQNTNYFQKFQVNPSCSYGFYEHQYMQGVDAVINEASYTFKNYGTLGILDKEHIFKLPVYENLSKVDYEAQDLNFKSAYFSDDYVYVNSNVSSGLALRTQPSTTTGITQYYLSRSTLLQSSGKSGVWYKVKVLNGTYKGSSGYVHGDYVNAVPKLSVSKGAKLTLKPKLRTSTCTYSLVHNTVDGAVSIKSGVAYGNKIGKALFKATTSAGTVGYLEMECTGQIDAPSFTLQGSKKSVKISWSPLKEAAYYRVYSYNASTKKYTRLVQTTATSYTVEHLADGTSYTYLVRAFDTNGGGSAYTAASNKSAVTISEAPSFKITALTTSATLSWSKVKGAEKYGIWSYNPSTDKYTKIANTTKLSYTVSSLKANTKYTFLVRTYNSSGWSEFTRAKNNKSVTTAPKSPSVSVANGDKAVRLSWDKCTGAKYYRIYLYNTSTKKYTRLAQTTALTYKHTKLAAGTPYIYLVRAFNSSDFGSDYSTKNHMTALTLCAAPSYSLSAGSSAVTLSWSKVKGAEKYGIWSYNSATDKYTKLANTTKTSYKVTDLKANTKYIFLVRAYNSSGWSVFTRANNKSVTTAQED